MALLLALPGLLTLYLAFSSGGLFEVTTAFAGLLVLVAAAIAVAAAPRPLAGFSRLGALACGLLALFALWTLLSAQWSDAGGRALVSFDRVLLYLAVLVLFASVPRTEERFRWLLRGLLAAMAAVALAGLTSRLAPDLWPTATGLVGDRLNYPLTYWNTFGLLVGLACILAVHLTADEREPAAARIGAAALLPALGATLLLTFSRGAIAVTVLGIVVYLLAARPRGLLGGFLAAAPPTAIALAQTYSAQLVHAGTPLTPAAISEADGLLVTLLVCMAAAAALRALALPLDERLRRWPGPPPSWRRRGWPAAGAAAALVLVAFLIAGGPSRLHREYERFAEGTHATVGDQRDRLLEVGNDGRQPLWEVARHTYDENPLHGSGAGTFQTQWQRQRSEGPERHFAYSLYLETAAELGLVGIVLLGGALLVLLIGLGLRMRGAARAPSAAAFALTLAWAVHAGIDIDWQSPAVCVPVFALAGLALAKPRERVEAEARYPGFGSRLPALLDASAGWLRPVLALACVALAVVPARMALAQTHLREGVEALNAGDCRRADSAAGEAIAAFETGARPYEVLAMCAAREQRPAAAVRWARAAVGHDPESWEPHYALALAQGVAGVAPERQARRAAAANPLAQPPREALAAFDGGGPARWRAAARRLPFAIE